MSNLTIPSHPGDPFLAHGPFWVRKQKRVAITLPLAGAALGSRYAGVSGRSRKRWMSLESIRKWAEPSSSDPEAFSAMR